MSVVPFASKSFINLSPLATEAADEQLQKAGAETFHKFQRFVISQYSCY